MHCANAEVLGLAAQWSFWAMLEIERLLLELLEHSVLLPEYSRDASVVERVELLLRKPLTVLNGVLDGRGFLSGDGFTIADLNVAGILMWGKLSRMDMSAYPNLARWLDACMARPAYLRLRERSKRK